MASLSKGCPALKTLKCHGQFLLTDPSLASNAGTGKIVHPWEEVIGIAAISQRCPNLDSLDLSGCFRLNRALGQFIAKLSNMKNLNLRGCNQCTSVNFIYIAHGMPLLDTLVLSDCGKAVNHKVLQAFAEKCKELKTLQVCRCEEVKESAIKAISFISKLQSLELSGCVNLTDSMLVHITQIERVPKLQHLDMTNCPKVADAFLAWMSLKPHELLYVYLRGTSVSKKALMSVRDRFPNCDMLVNDNFYGFWPKHRIKDRFLLNSYYQMIQGITKVQARVRKMIAITRILNINQERKRIAAQLLLQRVARGFIGRRRVYAKKHKRRVFRYAAVRITHLFRRVVARKKLERKKKERLALLKEYRVTKIQVRWRMYRDKRILARKRAVIEQRNKVREKAAIKIQSVLRMCLAKRRVRRIEAMNRTRERVRERKALVIQRCHRGYVSRERTKMFKQLLEDMKKQRLAGAKKIQFTFRMHRTKKIVKRRQAAKFYRLQCCIKIQAVMRGALARLHVMEMRMEEWVAQKKKAVLKIQCRWRVYKARYEFFRRIKERREWRVLMEQAASTIVRQARMKIACNLRRLKHAQYIERITAQANREIQAATRIQAMVRSHNGRKIYNAKLREKKGMWKELFDEEKGKRYFYNQLTGEVRWKIPKDLLDLIPHAGCDNCYKVEATLECAVCNEMFCGSCFQQVHRGGRRMGHDYRALYDYYGKRIDYGDGEFPCQWPSEVIQDEVQGWMLRIAPYRKPVETFNCGWEKYEEANPGRRTLKNQDEWRVKDSMGKEAPKVFYFNRNTFQTSYDVPEEVAHELATRTAPKVFDFGLFDGTSRTHQSLPGGTVPNSAAATQSVEVYNDANQNYYDPNYPDSYNQWYQGYYDENGNWIDYSYPATATDQSMALVPVTTDENGVVAGSQLDGNYEDYQSYDYGNNTYYEGEQEGGLFGDTYYGDEGK
ncbi:hypothetical protein EON65_09920 [archaeon]|nr:MAG: hypothetical protein EON65_09920 [archaeon]